MIPRTIGEFRDGGPTATAGPAGVGPARSRDAGRALRAAAAAAGLAVLGGYLAIGVPAWESTPLLSRLRGRKQD